MAAQPKGKTGTRGEKTIVKENEETLAFYRNIIFVTLSITVGFQSLLRYSADAYTPSFYGLHGLAICILFLCFKFMGFMAQVTRGAGGQIVNCGTDLNMENGLAEHLKDMIILTLITLVMALISDWCWLILLAAPLRGVYLFWVYIAAPWFFAEPSEDMGAKKTRKEERLERKQNKSKRS